MTWCYFCRHAKHFLPNQLLHLLYDGRRSKDISGEAFEAALCFEWAKTIVPTIVCVFCDAFLGEKLFLAIKSINEISSGGTQSIESMFLQT